MKKIYTLLIALFAILPVMAAGEGYDVGYRFMPDNNEENYLNIWFVVLDNTPGHRTCMTTYSMYENAYTGEKIVPETVPGNGVDYTVVGIGSSTFDGCVSLEKLVLPETIEFIESWGIAATGLKSIRIPASVTRINLPPVEEDGARAELGWGSLAQNLQMTEIIVDPANPNYTSYNGALCSKDLETLYQVPAGVSNYSIYKNTKTIWPACFSMCENLESIKIPDTVDEIGTGAFQYCTSLRRVNLPHGVTEISHWCFAGCWDLESISMHGGLEQIGMCAFEICPSLKTVIIPDTVETIVDMAFKDCSALTDVVIGLGATEIQEDAFMNCTALKNVTCYAVIPPTLGFDVFENVPVENVTLNVLEGSAPLYESEDQWKDFGSIVEVDYVGVKHVSATEAVVKAENGTLMVNCGNCGKAEVFNASGVKVAEGFGNFNVALSKGLYVVRFAGKSVKVMM